MRSWFVPILYLFVAIADSLAYPDIFNDVFSYDVDMLSPQYEIPFGYDEIGTGHTFDSLAWNLDNAFPLQEESFIADRIDFTDACILDSLEPVGKVRARRPVCETPLPRKKRPSIPFWMLQSDERDIPLDLTLTLEEFACNDRGYEYVVCDSGDQGNSEPDEIFMNHYYLLNCDLCKFE